MGTDSHARKELILKTAAEILIAKGDSGLTMRKIASESQMSLSNLQYYYPSRDLLLEDLVSQYFEACLSELSSLVKKVSRLEYEVRVQKVLAEGLSHGDSISDDCKIFRELWAISARNETVHNKLMEYYETYQLLVGEAITQKKDVTENKRIGRLLMPYFEGYSITAHSIKTGKKQLIQDLSHLVDAL